MSIKTKHVDGDDKGKVMLFALSTCMWCRKTKALLQDLNVEYDYADVDLLDSEEQDEAISLIKKFNSSGGFPTMVINDSNCIRGFDEDKIKEVFGK